jgi:hypothetical protein
MRGDEIVRLAAEHAVTVNEGPFGPLTPWGLAYCAAGFAHVLSNPHHANHDLLMARVQPEASAGGEAVEA